MPDSTQLRRYFLSIAVISLLAIVTSPPITVGLSGHYSHIKVELIPITNRVDEQVVLIASGLTPDILYLNPSFFGYFVRQGFLEDL